MALTDHLEDVPMDEPAPSVTDTASPTTDSSADPQPVPQAEPERPVKRRHPFRRFITVFLLIVFVALGVTFWIRYCNPYVTDAQARGFIQGVEKRGIIFKTFEGEMLRKSALDDTTSVYSRDFNFSVDSDSLARVLQSYAGTRRQVVVTYRSYYATLPWRGASRNVVEDVQPVDDPYPFE